MLGLVLWCDDAARRALIWCEDHGDLAWYEAGRNEVPPVSAGDLVHVGLGAGQGLRRVHGLRVLARGADAGLPRRLARAAAG